MLATHNRREDLRETLSICRKLDPSPKEILVYADGCTDGTADMVRDLFPFCTVMENEQRRGSIVCRDAMLREAKGELVLSLDDDSYPLQHDALALIQSAGEMHTSAAVIALREIRDADDSQLKVGVATTFGCEVSTYSSCAAAIRRSAYIASDGYPIFFEHAYEEPDYAVQSYGAARDIWFEPSILIMHRMSGVNRSTIRTHYLHSRNELWSVFMRCPFPQSVAVALYRLWRQFRFACGYNITWALRQPVWWWWALRGLGTCLRARRPIPWRVYYQWMKLSRANAGLDLFPPT